MLDTLAKEQAFYPGFRHSPLYVRMLAELDLERERSTSATPTSSIDTDDGSEAVGNSALQAHIDTIGIGREQSRSFALYRICARRLVAGAPAQQWHVLRRYSDFHRLNNLIETRVRLRAQFE